MNYLNLPLLAEFTTGNKIKFNADAGVFVGALLSTRTVTKYEDGTPKYVSTTRGHFDYTRRINYGISIGVGTQLPVTSKVKINLDVRNSTGLANTEKSSSSMLKTNSLSLLLGLSFML